MKGSKKKFDNSPYNIFLGRIYNQIDFDMIGVKAQNKIKRSFGITKCSLKMLSLGYKLKNV